MVMDCINKSKNIKRCNCTYGSCPRHGICCECLFYHLRMNELPACCFSKEAEATFDRSFEKFFHDRKLG